MIHTPEAKLHPAGLWTPPVSYRPIDWLRYILAGERGATGTALSDFLENKLLDHVLGATSYTAPGTIYTALFTAAPSDTGGGTEVTGGSYARVGKTNNGTNFPAASGGSKSNGTDIDFGTATANWGTVTHVGIFDAASAGNLLFWGALTTTRTVNTNDSFKFLATKLVFALD